MIDINIYCANENKGKKMAATDVGLVSVSPIIFIQKYDPCNLVEQYSMLCCKTISMLCYETMSYNEYSILMVGLSKNISAITKEYIKIWSGSDIFTGYDRIVLQVRCTQKSRTEKHIRRTLLRLNFKTNHVVKLEKL